MGYLDTAGFKLHSTMADAAVDELESLSPGFLAAQLDGWSTWIDAQLRKRYEAPFADPAPLTVKMWLARLVTPYAWTKRGVDPNDEQFQLAVTSAEAAATEIQAAANSETGLYDLPLRQDTTSAGISKGGPLGYSEASPYVWTDVQRSAAYDEDRNGSGTHG